MRIPPLKKRNFYPSAVYLAALYRLLGFFNLLAGSLGVWFLWRHRLDPQPWLARTAMAVTLLAYLAPIIFDNTVGHIGFFEILEHLLFAAMLVVGILVRQMDDISVWNRR